MVYLITVFSHTQQRSPAMIKIVCCVFLKALLYFGKELWLYVNFSRGEKYNYG